jgi:hypothetical protein
MKITQYSDFSYSPQFYGAAERFPSTDIQDQKNCQDGMHVWNCEVAEKRSFLRRSCPISAWRAHNLVLSFSLT